MGLGALLCWAVVFADVGTSVYYTPGILFGQVGAHAPLFVGMTLVVFVLLTMKYAEVAARYPEGGGVVTVGAHAVNPFVGLVGGLLILVDYFLTAALSSLSGIIYLSDVVPNLTHLVLPVALLALVLLGLLNLIGISESAKVNAVIAVIAAASQVAVVLAVLVHVGPGNLVAAVPRVLAGPSTNFCPRGYCRGRLDWRSALSEEPGCDAGAGQHRKNNDGSRRSPKAHPAEPSGDGQSTCCLVRRLDCCSQCRRDDDGSKPALRGALALRKRCGRGARAGCCP